MPTRTVPPPAFARQAAASLTFSANSFSSLHQPFISRLSDSRDSVDSVRSRSRIEVTRATSKLPSLSGVAFGTVATKSPLNLRRSSGSDGKRNQNGRYGHSACDVIYELAEVRPNN